MEIPMTWMATAILKREDGRMRSDDGHIQDEHHVVRRQAAEEDDVQLVREGSGCWPGP